MTLAPDTSPDGDLDPLLLARRLPLPFAAFDVGRAEVTIERLMAVTRTSLAAIGADERPPTWANTLGALEAATEALELATTLLSHLESVASSPELQAVQQQVQPRASELFSAIPHDAALWRRIKAYCLTEEASALEPVRARLKERTLDSFRRHGADLPDYAQARLRAVDVELTRATQAFAQNVLAATQAFELVVTDEAALAGLPDSARQAARQSAQDKGLEGFRLTLQAPSYIAVMTYADDRALRERLWRAYNTRAADGQHDNTERIREILRLRREKAELLGYTDFSDYALADRMAKAGARARDFVEDLTRRASPAAAREAEELRQFAAAELGVNADDLRVEPWDVSYWAEKLRLRRYDLDAEALRPWFALPKVMDGLFALVERVFDVSIEAIDGVPTWDPAVRTYRVRDRDGRTRGTFYGDLHPRDGKRDGAWMHGLSFAQEGRADRSEHVAVIAGNLSPPVGVRPSLLTHDEVCTIFHEFGHLLHHLLTEVPLRSLAGTNVAWDFVELPSQMLENWCWEREGLDLFARHFEDGSPLPDAMLERLLAARTFRAATGILRQLGFCQLDLCLHGPDGPVLAEDPVGASRAVLARFTHVEFPPDYAMICAFGHLFAHPTGYAAGYYGYQWAEVLDAHAFAVFQDASVLSAEVGRRFRHEVLARGDAREPMASFVAFTGREPDLTPYLRRAGLPADGAATSSTSSGAA